MSINFARSRDPAFYLIAVRILLNQSIRVFFSNDFFFFLLLSSFFFFFSFPPFSPPDGTTRPACGCRSIDLVEACCKRSQRRARRRTSTREFFFSLFFSLSLSLVLSTQKMKNHIFFVTSEKKNVVLTSSAFRRSATMIVVFREETQPFSRWP